VVAGQKPVCYTHADFDGPPVGGSRTLPRFAPANAAGAQDIGRVDVSEPASISTGIAARYATAIFELAKEGKSLTDLEADIGVLDAALKDSAEFRDLIASPVYSRGEQAAAMTAIATKAGLSQIVSNTLALMASKRRLFVLPQLVRELRAHIAAEKGEVTAEVTAASALTKTQQDKLARTLKERVGKDVKINMSVDESLIGGLVVKVGSRMIDTSIRSKLAALQNSMKEVG
jgi:F-type H+-transporting ATPase subunit delta